MRYISPARLHNMDIFAGACAPDPDAKLERIRRELKELKERIK